MKPYNVIDMYWLQDESLDNNNDMGAKDIDEIHTYRGGISTHVQCDQEFNLPRC